jgi:hypothetical protein
MHSVARNSSHEMRQAPARALGRSVLLEFDVTNSNVLDMRIVRLYVRVGEYTAVDIEDLLTGDLGSGMPIREYNCDIEPRPGVFDCSNASRDFDYVRLFYGELETSVWRFMQVLLAITDCSSALIIRSEARREASKPLTMPRSWYAMTLHSTKFGMCLQPNSVGHCDEHGTGVHTLSCLDQSNWAGSTLKRSVQQGGGCD